MPVYKLDMVSVLLDSDCFKRCSLAVLPGGCWSQLDACLSNSELDICRMLWIQRFAFGVVIKLHRFVDRYIVICLSEDRIFWGRW